MSKYGTQRGSALIEFSLLIMLLMLMSLGVFDFGLAIAQGSVVTAAAHAGAEYGATEGNSNNTAGMQTAAQNAGKTLGATLNASALTWCTCTVGSVTTVNCASLCNVYDLPFQYVQVKTTATVPILLRFPGFPLSIPLNAAATMRAR